MHLRLLHRNFQPNRISGKCADSGFTIRLTEDIACARTSSVEPMSRIHRSSTAITSELGRQESYALWTVANSIEPWQPQPTSLPQLWSYQAMRPLVLQGARPRQPGEGRPPRHRAGESRPQGHLGLRRLALLGLAGDEARRVRHRAQPRVVGAALRHRGQGRLHGGRRPQDGSRRPAISSSRRTAPGTITASNPTARRRSGRTASTCCWSTSSTPISTPCIPTACRSRTIRSTTPRTIYGGAGLLPAGGEAWSKPYSPLLKYEWGRTYETLVKAAAGDRRLALRRHHDAIRQSGDRRPGDEDARRQHPVAARRRAHQGASPHRLGRLHLRQGQRLFDHRRQALRLEQERHLRGAVLGMARARQRVRARGRRAVLVQRCAVDGGARALPRRNISPTTTAIRNRRTRENHHDHPSAPRRSARPVALQRARRCRRHRGDGARRAARPALRRAAFVRRRLGRCGADSGKQHLGAESQRS